jgi:hypothetical protein
MGISRASASAHDASLCEPSSQRFRHFDARARGSQTDSDIELTSGHHANALGELKPPASINRRDGPVQVQVDWSQECTV